MKKRTYLLIISLLIFAFCLYLGLLMNDILEIAGEKNIILYWIIKSVVLVSFLFVIVYSLFRKQDTAHGIIIYSSTLVIQFIPLFVRLLLRAETPRYTLSIVLSFVLYIIYLTIMFGFGILTDKTNIADEKLRGKSIEVIEEDSFNDSEGRFVSAGKKVNK